MNKTIISVAVVVVIAGLGAMMLSKFSQEANSPSESTSKTSSENTNTSTNANAHTAVDSKPELGPSVSATVGVGAVKELTVVARDFSFSPSKLTVKKGDTVRLTFKNDGGAHDLKVDEFGVATKKLTVAGETVIVEFKADKAGSFEYYCSVGSHRAMGMKGTLTVTE